MTVVRLDTASDPWVGTFPGLGRVLVHADGRIDVELEPVTELLDEDNHEDHHHENHHHEAHHHEIEQRTASLRHGWGAVLSSVRRGWKLVFGAGLVDADGRCLVVAGQPDGIAIVVSRLAGLGWGVLAERVQPVSWSGPPAGDHLVAHPSPAPLIVGRRIAEQHGLVGTPVRADSDALIVPMRRIETARPVAAFVHVRGTSDHRAGFAVLVGHERFDCCTTLLNGSTIANGGTPAPIDPPAHLAETLRLARLPHAELTIRTPEPGDTGPVPGDTDHLADLLGWWRDLPSPSGPT